MMTGHPMDALRAVELDLALHGWAIVPRALAPAVLARVALATARDTRVPELVYISSCAHAKGRDPR